ncbi:MAG: ABC transporter ATP-binding protein/permease [Christensenellaceae bacterium]|nr:ABC transporter ATP-binding protein/permease [Christensenellaceae bacterium]
MGIKRQKKNVRDYGFRKGLRKPFLLAVFSLLLQEALAIIYPLFLKNTTDIIKQTNAAGEPIIPSASQLIYSGSIVLAFIVAICVINIATDYFLSVYSAGVGRNVRKICYEKLTRISTDTLGEYGSSKTLATIINDSSWIKVIERGLVTLIVYFPITICGSFAVIALTLDFTYFLIAFASLPIALLIFFINSKILSKFMDKTAAAYDTFFETTRESIIGAKDIRALGKAKERSEESTGIVNVYRKQTRSINQSIRLGDCLNAVIFAVITAAIIWYGATTAVTTAAELVILSTAIQYIGNINTAFNNLYKWFIGGNTRGRTSYRRIYEFLELREEKNDFGIKQIPKNSIKTFEFKSVDLTDRSGESILSNINFQLTGGKHIAVTGAVGSGKTSLIKLICRYNDNYHGEILANGIDIREINKQFYRREIISHCSSSPTFIPATIRDNLTLFNPKLTDAEIIQIFRDIGAVNITNNKEFLNMQISNKSDYGRDIKTLINVVRTIVKPAEFYVFNRCFLGIPSSIVENIIRKLRDKNCIFITTSSTLCKEADETIFIEQGRVLAHARHEELLRDNKKYARFFYEQEKTEYAVNQEKPLQIDLSKNQDITKTEVM